MSRGKYQSKPKRLSLLSIVLIVLLAVAVISGGTMAYLAKSPEKPVKNSFETTPNPILTVNEDYSVSVSTGEADRNYAVYLRAAVVPNWSSGDSVIVVSQNSITVQEGTDWFLHTDGFYYYTKPISNGTTSPICEVSGENPGSYTLSVDIAVQAVQALGTTNEPTEKSAVLDAWKIPIQKIDSSASWTDPT